MASVTRGGGGRLGVRTFWHNLFRVKRPCDTDYDAPYAFFANSSNCNSTHMTANYNNNSCSNNNHHHHHHQHHANSGWINHNAAVTSPLSPLSSSSLSTTGRTRCVLRLVTCGLSGVLGLGVLVIVGHVANDVAGPAIVSSLVIAAVSSLLSGLCYAEFQTRQSELSDSVYACFYQSVGELPAFVIGWCMLLSHTVGLAVAGRSLSALVDYLAGHRVRDFWLERLGSSEQDQTTFLLLKGHPDFVAGFFVLAASLLFNVGRRWSRRLAVVVVTATVCVASMFVALCARHTGDTVSTAGDWSTSSTTANDFLPNESTGLLSGAAICTFSFSAHYSMDFKVKGNRRPERNIPLAIGITLTTCFVLYFAVSTVLTLVTHRRKLDSDVPLVQVFELLGITWALYVTAIGEGFCLTLTLLSLSYALYSSVMALGNDGLLFRCVVTGRRGSKNSNSNKHTAISTTTSSPPLLPSLLFGAISALLSTTFPLTSLLHIIALPSLVINTLVCNCVLYQRYQPDNVWLYEPLKLISNSSSATSPAPSSSLKSSASTSPEKTATTTAAVVDNPAASCIKFRINKQAVFPLVKQTSLTQTTDTDDDDDDDQDEVRLRCPIAASIQPLLDIPSSRLVESDLDAGYDQDSSDTDIDAIVAEYKEKIRVATLTSALIHIERNSSSCDSDDHCQQLHFPTEVTGRRVLISVVVLSLGLFALSVSLVLGSEAVARGNLFVALTLCLLVTMVVAILVIIVRQPQNRSTRHTGAGSTMAARRCSSSSRVFHVPFLPLIPAIGTFINLCLFVNTMQRQWAPFMVWMIIGSGIYCVYGMWNSTAARQTTGQSRRAEKIKLKPLPTQPFLSSVLPIHNSSASNRITQVDTILISR